MGRTIPSRISNHPAMPDQIAQSRVAIKDLAFSGTGAEYSDDFVAPPMITISYERKDHESA